MKRYNSFCHSAVVAHLSFGDNRHAVEELCKQCNQQDVVETVTSACSSWQTHMKLCATFHDAVVVNNQNAECLLCTPATTLSLYAKTL